jgi:hypothetical protein
MRKDWQFGVALRRSGYADFYWNSIRVSSSEEDDLLETFNRIEMNF